MVNESPEIAEVHRFTGYPKCDATAFWVGYSVRDDEGRWYDAPPRPVFLEPGARSDAQEISTGPLGSAGTYDTRVSVWDRRPGSEGAERLADAERPDAFTVAEVRDLWSRDDFASRKTGRWRPTEKTPGRGRPKTENVAVADEKLRIRLPAGTLEGGGDRVSGHLQLRLLRRQHKGGRCAVLHHRVLPLRRA